MKNYPENLTAEYEMLECLAFHDDSETILSSRRSDEKLFVIKVFFSESPLYDFVVPDEIKDLDHPAIPKFIDEYRSDDLRYEIREYVPGTPLDKLLQNKELSRQDKDSIVSQLCDILQFLHTRPVPVIHRDIKPQNIIISNSGKVYLIDFGIARTRKDIPGPSDTVICATRDFSAPEQYGFMETDCRSDVYSFGRVLKWLYYEDPKDLEPIIDKCTAFDPGRRYSSIREVRRAISAKHRLKKLIPRLIIILIAVAFLIGGFVIAHNKNRLSEPLLEEAVRKSLGVGNLHPISSKDLQRVEGIYIVADKAYATADEFYAAVDDWYADDRKPEGTITSIEDCSKLTGLKELCIAGGKITDLAPIRSCSQMEKIEIKHNDVNDITVLGSIPSIVYVGINSNPVTDITPLINLKQLRYLDTCNVKVSDPSVFEKLGDFEYLDIDNGTQAYKYLSGKTIRHLRLGNIYTKNLSFLKEINGLETVQLNFICYEQIQDLGEIDFEVIYEGIDVPVQEPSYKKAE